jgi:hypothetical protein
MEYKYGDYLFEFEFNPMDINIKVIKQDLKNKILDFVF